MCLTLEVASIAIQALRKCNTPEAREAIEQIKHKIADHLAKTNVRLCA